MGDHPFSAHLAAQPEPPKDGSPLRTGRFDSGAQVGVWRTFDRSGKLVKETKF